MVNYKNGIVYKIYCKDSSITDIYIGSTTNFNNRRKRHKTACTNEKSKGYNYTVYQYIREHGGWDNWDIIEVEQCCAKDKDELLERERYWIRHLDTTLNKTIPGRTRKEWYQDNKESVIQRTRKYYQEHKEEIAQKKAEYRQEHKEEIAEYHKKYNIDNNTKLNKYRRNYYEKNKDILLEKQAKHNKEKVTCECGSSVSRHCLTRHKTSHKHKKIMEEKLKMNNL